MGDKALHRRIAKYLLTVGTSEVTRAIDVCDSGPGDMLDTDHSRRLPSAKSSTLTRKLYLRELEPPFGGSFGYPWRNASEPQQFGRSLGQWHCVCRMPQGDSIAAIRTNKLTTREALLLENYCGCTR
jgi:hypothetical protein